MKVGKFIFTGLGTDPKGACCGMRPMADRLFGPSDPDTFYHSWDEDSPDAVCRAVLAQIQSGNYDRTLCFGHSFGGAFLKFFGDWLCYWHPKSATIDLAVFFDPAPNGPQFGQWCMWQLAQRNDAKRWHAPACDAKVLCYYQHNQSLAPRPDEVYAGHIVGVCGVPFSEAAAKVDGIDLTNVDASPWGVSHVSIISEQHVQDQITAAVVTVTSQKPAVRRKSKALHSK